MFVGPPFPFPFLFLSFFSFSLLISSHLISSSIHHRITRITTQTQDSHLSHHKIHISSHLISSQFTRFTSHHDSQYKSDSQNHKNNNTNARFTYLKTKKKSTSTSCARRGSTSGRSPARRRAAMTPRAGTRPRPRTQAGGHGPTSPWPGGPMRPRHGPAPPRPGELACPPALPPA
jgi:hypothetical protein